MSFFNALGKILNIRIYYIEKLIPLGAKKPKDEGYKHNEERSMLANETYIDH